VTDILHAEWNPQHDVGAAPPTSRRVLARGRTRRGV